MTLYRQGKVPGSFYDGFGQEAVSAGATWAMAAAGPPVHPAPRPRRAHHPRRRAVAHLRPVHGPPGRHHPRPRRQRPLRRPHEGLRRHGLDAAGHDADRHRHGDGVQAARRAARRHHLVRRRLDLARRLPRGHELGRRAAPAGDLRAGEQPVRVLHAAGPAVRGRPGASAPRPTGSRASRSTATTPRRCSRSSAARAARAVAGEGPDADRGRDDAHARPRARTTT